MTGKRHTVCLRHPNLAKCFHHGPPIVPISVLLLELLDARAVNLETTDFPPLTLRFFLFRI